MPGNSFARETCLAPGNVGWVPQHHYKMIQLQIKWVRETSTWTFRGHLHQDHCYDAEEIEHATKAGKDHTGLPYPFLYNERLVHKMESTEGLPVMKPVSLRRGMKIMLLIISYTYAIKREKKKVF